LSELAVSIERQQIYAVGATTAAASYRQALNRLAKAQLNLRRALSLVDAHSFWVERKRRSGRSRMATQRVFG
jgi:hypothetical protein